MTGALRQVPAALAALAATAGIVALSRAPYPTGDDAALLRLSWSGRPERIERCRELSDEELAKRPAHMRRRLECEGRSARYAVEVSIGGRAASLDTVTGGGVRGDRAIHMLREYRLAPGEHEVEVEIERLDSAAAPDDEPEEEGAERPEAGPLDRARRERDERRRQREEMLPAALELDTVLRMPPHGVVLVTYDASRRRLLAVTGGDGPSP